MESFSLVIFGITSNLAQIKLIPALYLMAEKNLLPAKMKIIGVARKEQSNDQFREYFYQALLNLPNQNFKPKKSVCKKLCQKLFYVSGEAQNKQLYQKLHQQLHQFYKSDKHNLIFYLATYPELYQSIFQHLRLEGLNEQSSGWVRIMIEKPMGTDLKTAKHLNRLLSKYFAEDQIYRLDHYLGKETVQNILTFRFGNGLFEPLLNKKYVDHIQIISAESFGIGLRGGYYDNTGSLKDVGQNHLLELLTFAVMDAPAQFNNQEVTKQRIKVLQKLEALPAKVVFGQYQGYQNEERVNKNSQTETFFALKTYLRNNRFRGVPIYIRAGKKLAQSVTEISIIFKTPSNRLFKHLDSGMEPNVLTYRIQPNEGIVLSILTKTPSHQLKLDQTYMQFCYRLYGREKQLPDPYVRLILDVLRGDQTFFADAKEVELEWAFIDKLLKVKRQTYPYQPQSWGPKEANQIIEQDQKTWLTPSPLVCPL
ncbi:glucose-6-phosphate dehydrogenase [Patescibacteria group bacterium]|nr:glucose-6-phosphate dehydrogenase [Patescibacteria group bacterium]MCL5409981.1 glucose-6-phosphate dehydrogenase [Patescibacteria group bacterium]